MTGGKKWMAQLTEEHYDWLQKTIDKTDLKGSEIVREMFDVIMQDDKRFIASLANARLKIKLQDLNDKKAALLEQERELKKQYSEEKIVA